MNYKNSVSQLFGVKLQTPTRAKDYISNHILGLERKPRYGSVPMREHDWRVYHCANSRELVSVSDVATHTGLTQLQVVDSFDRIKANRLGFVCDVAATHVQTIAQWWETESAQKMVRFVYFQHYVRIYTAVTSGVSHRRRMTFEEFVGIAYVTCSGFTRKYSPAGKSAFTSYAQMRLIHELTDIHAALFTGGLTNLPNRMRKSSAQLSALRVPTRIQLSKHGRQGPSIVDMLNEIHAREEQDTSEQGLLALIRSKRAGLNDNETIVMLGLYCEGLTMKAIGVKLGLSESRVSQMHAGILPRLRELVVRKGLHYVG